MRILKLVCLLLCLAMVLPSAVTTNAATSTQIQNEIQALKQEEKDIQEKIDELESLRNDNLTELSAIYEQKQLIDQQISLLNQQVSNVRQQLRSLKDTIADQQEAYDNASANHAALTELYRLRIRAMEEQGSLSYWSVLFSANSFSDFLDRINMVREIAAADRMRLDTLRKAAQKVDAEKELLVSQQAQLQETADTLAANEATLAEKRSESEALLRQLMSQEAEYEALLAEQEEEQMRLAQELANKKSEFNAALYREWLASQPPVTPSTPTVDNTEKETKPEGGSNDNNDNNDNNNNNNDNNNNNNNNNGNTESAPTLPTIGGWVMPVPASHILSSPFGMRMDPTTGQMRMHNGIDLACPEGTHIFAGNGGQVLQAAYSSSMGNYVLIDHGSGYRTIYMHMTHSIVTAGQYVQAGQHIGYVGNTGASRGNHLHYGVSYNGTYINPYNFVYGN